MIRRTNLADIVASIFLVLIFFLALPLLVSAFQIRTPHPFVEKQLGDLRLRRETLADVIRLYGIGVRQQIFHGEMLCYYVERQRAYLFLIFQEGLLVTIRFTTSPDEILSGMSEACRQRIIKRKAFLTGKGVGLGDPADKVTRLYGTPQGKEEVKDLVIFKFETDHVQDPAVDGFYNIHLYFKQGRLVALIIHDGE